MIGKIDPTKIERIKTLSRITGVVNKIKIIELKSLKRESKPICTGTALISAGIFRVLSIRKLKNLILCSALIISETSTRVINLYINSEP